MTIPEPVVADSRICAEGFFRGDAEVQDGGKHTLVFPQKRITTAGGTPGVRRAAQGVVQDISHVRCRLLVADLAGDLGVGNGAHGSVEQHHIVREGFGGTPLQEVDIDLGRDGRTVFLCIHTIAAHHSP